MGNVNASGGAAAVQIPRANFYLPHAGVNRLGVVRIHGKFGAAGILVDEQHLFPCLTAVMRAINPAFVLWAICLAESARENDIGIVRIDDDPTDMACKIKTHVLPSASAVC